MKGAAGPAARKILGGLTLAALLVPGLAQAQAPARRPAGPVPRPGGPSATPDATEKANADSIAQVLNGERAALHRCWEKAAADGYKLKGQVLLTLTLGKAGAPKKIDVARDEPADPVLTACLVGRARQWRFEGFADGEKIELPLDFAAPKLQHTVRFEDAPAFKPKVAKLEARVLVDQASTGATRASLTVLRVAGHTQIPLHTHTSHEVWVLLDGLARIQSLGNPKGEVMKAGDAAFLPAGTAHGFSAIGSAKTPTRLLVLWTPGGPERPFRDPKVKAEGTVALRPDQRKQDPSAPQPVFVPVAKVADTPIAGGRGAVKVMLPRAAGTNGLAYAGHLRLDAGATVPGHKHDREDELLYVVEGGGLLTVGKDEMPVEAGMAVWLPCNTPHAFVAGRQGLRAVQMYVPGGPEGRFGGGKATQATTQATTNATTKATTKKGTR